MRFTVRSGLSRNEWFSATFGCLRSSCAFFPYSHVAHAGDVLPELCAAVQLEFPVHGVPVPVVHALDEHLPLFCDDLPLPSGDVVPVPLCVVVPDLSGKIKTVRQELTTKERLPSTYHRCCCHLGSSL